MSTVEVTVQPAGMEEVIKAHDPNSEGQDVSNPSLERTSDTYEADDTSPVLLDEFADMDEEVMLEQATVVDNKAMTMKRHSMIKPPVIPTRSSLRASMVLDKFKMNSIETATQAVTAPHDVYLSSEEDASSSADEFSDYDFEDDDDDESASEVSSPKSHVRTKSYEDTARIVSVIYSGKPHMVELHSPRRTSSSDSRHSSEDSDSHSMESHPPRKSSLTPCSSQASTPSFLETDPFANANYAMAGPKQEKLDGTPPRSTKVPTAALSRVQRTFSLVRKQSRPMLRTAVSASVSTIDTSSLATASPIQQTPISGSSPESTQCPFESLKSPPSSTRYSDIIKVAESNTTSEKSSKAAQFLASSALSPTKAKRSMLASLKVGRRRSVKP